MSLILTFLLSITLMLGIDGTSKARRGTFALTNARIETVSHGTIEQGTIVIRNDIIVALGPDVDIPAGAEVIDCGGLSIYPGMIDAGTQLGLTEIGSVGETNDATELGDITPQMDALTAVNPTSVLIPVTRVSGVTTVLTVPSGGTFPGAAALINLHGYTPQQILVGDRRVMILSFPTSGRSGRNDRRSDEEIQEADTASMDKLDETWTRANLYAHIDSTFTANPDMANWPEYVPEMQAMLPVLRGDIPLMITVNRARDILKALEWVKKHAINNAIFSGVAEGWRVADKIAASGIPCLVGPVISRPTRESDRYDKAYANAGLLHAAGVTIAIRSGDSENVRNLPYHAGFAATYGLGREEALKSVTLNPAKIFGVDHLIGTLEPGKKANLFVTDGDPFEPKTQVSHVFIDGYKIPLENRHTRLYEEFLEREPGLVKHQ